MPLAPVVATHLTTPVLEPDKLDIRYRVEVRDFGSSFVIGDLIAEIDNVKNLGYGRYLNGVPEFFFTLNQEDPMAATLADYVNKAHVRVLRNDRIVADGWLMDSDENQTDVIFYGYGYAAGLFWSLSDWNEEFTGSEIGTIVRSLWDDVKVLDSGGLQFVSTGTIESPATAGAVGELARFGTGPVLERGSAGAWDAGEINGEFVYWDYRLEQYVMFYSARDAGDYDIGLAYSADLKNWVKEPTNPVFTANATEVNVVAPVIVQVTPSSYRMYYQSYLGTDGGARIYAATSTDLLTWARANGGAAVLTPGAAGQWDDEFVFDPYPMYWGGTTYLWYGGQKTDDTRGIGRASSTDGITFTKEGRLFTPAAGEANASFGAPAVTGTPNHYSVYHDAALTTSDQVRFICRNDTDDAGATFTHNHQVLKALPGSWDSIQTFDSAPIIVGGVLHLFYAGSPIAGAASDLDAEIGLATPSTARADGARLTLPLYTVFYKRVLFILQELAALAQSDTGNIVQFEITSAEQPQFNFWANRGIELTDVVWEFGGLVNGFSRQKRGTSRRNDLKAVGAAPHNALLRKEAQDATDWVTYFRRQEPIFLSWVRDETEVERVAKRRLATATQEDTTIVLRMKPNSVVPPGGLSSHVRIGDSPRVVIDHGATQIDRHMVLTGYRVTFDGNSEQFYPILEDKIV